MSFSPQRGSNNTLVSLSGASLLSVTGVFLTSGATGAQATIVSTSTNLITFYPPVNAPSGIRSGNWTVYNKFGQATTSNYWTVIANPFISGITPGSGYTGQAVRIHGGDGLRDITGLYFGNNTGVFSAIYENSNWVLTGYVPFFSGDLTRFLNVKVMSEAGSSTSPQLFVVLDGSIAFTGLTDTPDSITALNYLRGTSDAKSLEWRTPSQARADIGAVYDNGDTISGNYYLTGGALYSTGIVIQATGITTGDTVFSTRTFSGNYLLLEATIGGVAWRGFSYKFS